MPAFLLRDSTLFLLTDIEGENMDSKYSGSCLCGSASFEIFGNFENFYLCHCRYCRKGTGSAHAANLFSSTAKLAWLSGQEKISLFNLPSTRHNKCFCSVCGSALPYTINGKLLVVPAGSLDDEISIRPNAHIFTASKAGWDDALENVPKLPGLPAKAGA
jgi:hypothetical protein